MLKYALKEWAAICQALAEGRQTLLLRKGGVDWQMIYYSGAVHSFTSPAAGNDPSKGVAYNERADRRSWAAMKQFFAEIFH